MCSDIPLYSKDLTCPTATAYSIDHHPTPLIIKSTRMKAYLSLLLAIVAPSLADELQVRGGGGDDGWGGGGGGWGTTTEIIYTTSKLFNLNLSL